MRYVCAASTGLGYESKRIYSPATACMYKMQMQLENVIFTYLYKCPDLELYSMSF